MLDLSHDAVDAISGRPLAPRILAPIGPIAISPKESRNHRFIRNPFQVGSIRRRDCLPLGITEFAPEPTALSPQYSGMPPTGRGDLALSR